MPGVINPSNLIFAKAILIVCDSYIYRFTVVLFELLTVIELFVGGWSSKFFLLLTLIVLPCFFVFQVRFSFPLLRALSWLVEVGVGL